MTNEPKHYSVELQTGQYGIRGSALSSQHRWLVVRLGTLLGLARIAFSFLHRGSADGAVSAALAAAGALWGKRGIYWTTRR
jgi:hypothetical protein